MIKKMDHINIVVKNLEKAKEFFLDLGFVSSPNREGLLEGSSIEQVTGLNDVKAFYCTLSIPGTQTNLELIRYESPKDQDDPLIDKPNHVGIRHIAFEVENIEKLVRKLKKKGIQFISEIQEYEAARKKLCYFYGPEGVVLELAAYENS